MIRHKPGNKNLLLHINKLGGFSASGSDLGVCFSRSSATKASLRKWRHFTVTREGVGVKDGEDASQPWIRKASVQCDSRLLWAESSSDFVFTIKDLLEFWHPLSKIFQWPFRPGSYKPSRSSPLSIIVSAFSSPGLLSLISSLFEILPPPLLLILASVQTPTLSESVCLKNLIHYKIHNVLPLT